MERKHDSCSPFIARRNPGRKSSAEIVSEVRRSLRVQSTRRPFTPGDGHRRLFGRGSIAADHEDRPPSSFSLQAPDSRPASGIRLSPLDHKPKLPVPSDAKVFPKPPTDPPEVKGRLARLRRSGSLPTLRPLGGVAAVELASDPPDVCSRPQKRGGTAGESRVKQPGEDSGSRPAAPASAQRAAPGCGDDVTDATRDNGESSAWKESIAPLLRQMEGELGKTAAWQPSDAKYGGCEASARRLCVLCDRLHGDLTDADLLGRRCAGRPRILRTLLRLADLRSARLRLCVARLCFALDISGNELLSVCKLVFGVSCDEGNDFLFQDEALLDALLGLLSVEDVSTHAAALVYCAGTLKCLSANGSFLRRLLDKNFIGSARKLLQRLCSADAAAAKAGQVLLQLTATLRNLANLPEARPLFVSLSVMSELCVVLRVHRRDTHVCTNVSRILSKLSSYPECLAALAQTPDCCRLFLEVLDEHHQKQDLVVRLLFILGNLAADSDASRLQLFLSDGSVATLLRLYDRYQCRAPPPQEDPPPPGEPPPPRVRENEDVLVKLVRVLANMSIHPTVGPHLATDERCIQLLTETLELRSVSASEELMVNAAAAINNLSYYQEESAALRRSRIAVAELMMKLLLSSSRDAMLEAVRVYGNLSLHQDVRGFIMQHGVHRFIVTLLDSKSADVCFSACGVVTNLAVDPPNRRSLSLEGAAVKLVDCLRDLGAADWLLGGQICQALWNLGGGGGEALLDRRGRACLLRVLVTLSDEDEALKWVENDDLRDFHKACWEMEFLPAAQRLMKTLQPLERTDEEEESRRRDWTRMTRN
ncbi:armadillo repeat-containing protein 2 isoform X2 [Antennarius striatus]|uniref:armadillo repeat-containing protein 2 isoform X2 n=1 Tax=Antennarius striatus TaxID=241820 RepID=UPI0035B1C607